jgi:PAS domain S-box-containing protein
MRLLNNASPLWKFGSGAVLLLLVGDLLLGIPDFHQFSPGWYGGLVVSLLEPAAVVWLVLVTRNDALKAQTERDRTTEANAAIQQYSAALEELNAKLEQREHQLLRYRLLADVTQDIILFIDRNDMTIIEANAAALKAHGYQRSELIGQPMQILRADDVPIEPAIMAGIDTLTGAIFERVHRRADGTTFPIEIFARAADVDGRRLLLVTARDITERRQAAEQVLAALDQAVEASRAKSEFVATMSHEIRTPMHGVLGMSELLLERPLGPVEREYATTLKESAQALLAIINDILDFSKLEANKIELEAVPFDPAALVAGAIDLLRSGARNKGLELHLKVSRHVPRAVLGDPTRLRQILINLVGNAIKFTATGEVTISTSVERDDAGRSCSHSR